MNLTHDTFLKTFFDTFHKVYKHKNKIMIESYFIM